MKEESKKYLYCFDSSAFMALNRTSNDVYEIPIAVWEQLEEMMKDGKIISHELVFNEIDSKSKKPDFLARWVRDKKEYFLETTSSQISIVQDIIIKFPRLIDYRCEREQADPWLIALAIEKSKEQTLFQETVPIVVSQESSNSDSKIPAVCKNFGIQHRSLREFFDEIGLSAVLNK